MIWKCEKFVSDNCRHENICNKTGICMGYSKYIQPINQLKENPMENKVIFESEEQFVNFWKDLTGCDCLPGTREKMKQKGYIRKSAVEQAEEIVEKYYRKSHSGINALEANTLIYGFQELKSENERLRNE